MCVCVYVCVYSSSGGSSSVNMCVPVPMEARRGRRGIGCPGAAVTGSCDLNTGKNSEVLLDGVHSLSQPLALGKLFHLLMST